MPVGGVIAISLHVVLWHENCVVDTGGSHKITVVCVVEKGKLLQEPFRNLKKYYPAPHLVTYDSSTKGCQSCFLKQQASCAVLLLVVAGLLGGTGLLLTAAAGKVGR